MTEPAKQEDDLAGCKRRGIGQDPQLHGGAQRAIYDDARDFLREPGCQHCLCRSRRLVRIRAVLDDPACFKGTTIQDPEI